MMKCVAGACVSCVYWMNFGASEGVLGFLLFEFAMLNWGLLLMHSE